MCHKLRAKKERKIQLNLFFPFFLELKSSHLNRSHEFHESNFLPGNKRRRSRGKMYPSLFSRKSKCESRRARRGEEHFLALLIIQMTSYKSFLLFFSFWAGHFFTKWAFNSEPLFSEAKGVLPKVALCSEGEVTRGISAPRTRIYFSYVHRVYVVMAWFVGWSPLLCVYLRLQREGKQERWNQEIFQRN